MQLNEISWVWSQRKVIGRQDRSLVCPTIGLYAFAWILLSACKLRGFVEEQITRRGGLPAGRRSLRASLGIPRLMRRALEIMRRKTIARSVGNPHTRKVAIHHRAFLLPDFSLKVRGQTGCCDNSSAGRRMSSIRNGVLRSQAPRGSAQRCAGRRRHLQHNVRDFHLQ